MCFDVDILLLAVNKSCILDVWELFRVILLWLVNEFGWVLSRSRSLGSTSSSGWIASEKCCRLSLFVCRRSIEFANVGKGKNVSEGHALRWKHVVAPSPSRDWYQFRGTTAGTVGGRGIEGSRRAEPHGGAEYNPLPPSPGHPWSSLRLCLVRLSLSHSLLLLLYLLRTSSLLLSVLSLPRSRPRVFSNPEPTYHYIDTLTHLSLYIHIYLCTLLYVCIHRMYYELKERERERANTFATDLLGFHENKNPRKMSISSPTPLLAHPSCSFFHLAPYAGLLFPRPQVHSGSSPFAHPIVFFNLLHDARKSCSVIFQFILCSFERDESTKQDPFLYTFVIVFPCSVRFDFTKFWFENSLCFQSRLFVANYFGFFTKLSWSRKTIDWELDIWSWRQLHVNPIQYLWNNMFCSSPHRAATVCSFVKYFRRIMRFRFTFTSSMYFSFSCQKLRSFLSLKSSFMRFVEALRMLQL